MQQNQTFNQNIKQINKKDIFEIIKLLFYDFMLTIFVPLEIDHFAIENSTILPKIDKN